MIKKYIKILNKFSVIVFAVVFSFSIISPVFTLAAVTPPLGMATTYAILGDTYTNTSVTTVNGGVGFTTPPAVAPLGTHVNYGSGIPYATAGVDQGTALTLLNSQGCTFNFPAGAINLSTDITHGTIGVYTPGVYCSSGAMDIGGPLLLNGSGTYIFRSAGALTSTVGAVVSLVGTSACDVFWTSIGATTFGANTTFIGTLISNAGITVGANTTWTGRALAFGGTVTSDTDTITTPKCSSIVTGTLTGGIPSGVSGSLSGSVSSDSQRSNGGNGGGGNNGTVLGVSSGSNNPGSVLGATTSSSPGFPNTGFSPVQKNNSWGDFMGLFQNLWKLNIR